MSRQENFDHPDWRSLLTHSTKQETLDKRAAHRTRMADVNRWLRKRWTQEKTDE